MTSSETARAIVFVSLVVLGCLIRTYIRTANGEKEDEAHFWSSRFSQQKEHTLSSEKAPISAQHASIRTVHHLGADAHRPRSTNTSSGEVSQAVSVLHEQTPRFAPFLADTVPDKQHGDFLPAVPASTSLHPGSIHTCDGSEVDEAYEDWAAMHHARGAVSEDAETSIDNLLQRRQLHKAMGICDFDALDASGAETPTIWTAQFPAAQLRPY